MAEVNSGLYYQNLIKLEGKMRELSWRAIKKMERESTTFPTPAGRGYYSIANTNDWNKTFTFWRTTGKESFVCRYSDVVKVAGMVKPNTD